MNWKVVSTLVVLAIIVAAWALLDLDPQGPGRSDPKQGLGEVEPDIEHVVQAILASSEPLMLAEKDRRALRDRPRLTLQHAEAAWSAGHYWRAAAMLEAIRSSGAAARAWLPQPDKSRDPEAGAAAALSIWFIDANTERLMSQLLQLVSSRLLPLQYSHSDELPATPSVARAFRILASLDVPVTQFLVHALDGSERFAALEIMEALGPMAGHAVAALEKRAIQSAAFSSEPVFGTDVEGIFLETILRTLPSLGRQGEDAFLRLLFLEDLTDPGQASDVLLLLLAQDAIEVTSILREAERRGAASIPPSVYYALGALPVSRDDWSRVLELAKRARPSGQRAFLDAALHANLEREEVDILVASFATWETTEDDTVRDMMRDAMVRLAPADPRTGEMVSRVLDSGDGAERVAVLSSLAETSCSIPQQAKTSLLSLATDSDEAVRVAAIRLLANPCYATVAEARAILRESLRDDSEDVVLAALRAMASMGHDGTSLVPLARDIAAAASPDVQVAAVRAILLSGADPSDLVDLVMRIWMGRTSASERSTVRDDLLSVLDEVVGRGLSITPLPTVLLKTKEIEASREEKLRALSRAGR